MADTPDRDEKTEAPTDQRRRKAAEDGDVLQSRELGTALVVLAGAGWLTMAGPWMMSRMQEMLQQGLRFGRGDIADFDPARTALRLLGTIALPLGGLLALTFVAAIATPALLGSLGFRASAFSFKPSKLNPASGLKRIFGMQGWTELGKSIAKVVLLGGIGWWLFRSQQDSIIAGGGRDVASAIGELGRTFVLAMLVMAVGLVVIAGIDVPAQILQRGGRLRMTKQEVKDEYKQTEGSPELKAQIRRRQMQSARGSVRSAMADATVVLTNPTHFAVALRYRPGIDAAPLVTARGRGVTADAIRELAGENEVPILSYPQLARAIYFSAQNGQVIREDLYIAVATVLAFVFNLEAAMADPTRKPAAAPEIDVPPDARFDEEGRRGA
jgi:flagellar biosynthetic protein FlhB